MSIHHKNDELTHRMRHACGAALCAIFFTTALTPPTHAAPAAPKEKTAKIIPAPAKTATTEEKSAADATEVESENAPTLLVTAKQDSAGTTLTFPFTGRVAASAFRYHDQIWLVFNQPHTLALDLIKTLLPRGVTNLRQLPSDTHTILIMDSDGSLYPRSSRENTNFRWSISLLSKSRFPEDVIPVDYRSTGSSPNIFFPVLEAAKPLSLQSPESGETLTISPTYLSSNGVYPARALPQATVLETAQGVATIIHADDTNLRSVRNGLMLSSAQGLVLTKNQPPLSLEKLNILGDTKDGLFPYTQWKLPDGTKPYEALAQVKNRLASATQEQADLLNVQLAQHLLAEELHFEAASLLNQLEESSPDFFKQYDIAILRAGANFMAGRLQEAASDFYAEDVPLTDELEYWQQVMNLVKNNSSEPIAFTTFDRLYAKYYPPHMRQKLMLVGADHYINKGQYNQALQLMDRMNSAGLLDAVIDEVDYLIAKIANARGKTDAAREIWENVYTNTDNRYIRARTQFALTTMLYENGGITTANAIKRLEPVRVMWRDDMFERDLLLLIARLYKKEGMYREALNAWREITTNYPSDLNAIESAKNMSLLYQDLFLNGGADSMKPLDALSLFYEFRDLSPIGKKGDEMVQNLSDLLAKVDLLDRAAALLSHQIRFRLEGLDRSKIGARLALLHLLNRKPNEALNVLKVTGYGGNSAKLQRARDHLTAKALLEVGEYDRTLRILAADTSQDAMVLKLQAYWDQSNWLGVIDIAEDILATRKRMDAPLTNTEGAALIKLAVAYLFEDDITQLRYLRDYFGPLMQGNANQAVFLHLTDNTTPVTAANIGNMISNIKNIEGFLDSYRKDIADKGLSGAIE